MIIVPESEAIFGASSALPSSPVILCLTETSLLPVWPGDTLWINKCISGAQTDNLSIPCHCVGGGMPPVCSLIGCLVVLCVWWGAVVGQRFNEAGGRWVIAAVTSSNLAEVIITSRVNVWNYLSWNTPGLQTEAGATQMNNSLLIPTPYLEIYPVIPFFRN